MVSGKGENIDGTVQDKRKEKDQRTEMQGEMEKRKNGKMFKCK